jgi:hypothetical protein
MSSVRVSMKPGWDSDILNGIESGEAELMVDIHRRSNILAPVDTGAMVNSSLIQKLGRFVFSITYGNSRVRYARRQFFENKTKSRYLSKAAENVMRGDISRYFRGKV